MQERRVTVLGTTHELPDPFFVLATQNPVELEGTYPLPEAQIDRFLFKLEVPRSDAATLERIVRGREFGVEPEVGTVLGARELTQLLELTRRIFLPDAVAGYIARLVDATHPGQSAAAAGVKFGASPRAALGLASAARARALMLGRVHAGFEDVRAIAPAVLGHRLIMDYESRIAGRKAADVVTAVLSEVPVQPGGLPWTVQGKPATS
jgi:MoxR-like ATPase